MEGDMKSIAVRVASGLVVVVGVAAAAAPPGAPLHVYVAAAKVEARPEVDDATKNALKAKRDQAREARRALEKQLKDQLGKKRESWPPEKDDELYRLEEAEALADADFEYRKIDPKGLTDAVENLAGAFQGKGMAGKKDWVALVPSAAEADIVVEVAARRAGKTLPTQLKADRCFLLFTVGRGEKLDAARFAKVPADYRAKKFGLYAWKIASPRPDRPVFYFESYNGGGNEFGCHGQAANQATVLVNKFVEDNYAVLTGK
jgi:hypothetical protein